MASLQEQVRDVCRLADAVVENPSIPVLVTASNIGVCNAIVMFAAGGGMLFAPFIVWSPVVIWAIKKLMSKKKERQEKERMLREVIRKQQAVIRKLEQELVNSRQQNKENRQEIENLKKVLGMLEETKEYLNAA